jgi:cyanophycinase-like exopeptidase
MPYDAVLAWIRGRIAAPRGIRAGNLLILKASGERDYSDTFYAHSRLRAVREILIPPCVRNREVDRMASYVRTADAILFAGGDQAHYVVWKQTKLIDAVRAAYARGAVIGGGSAGLAIQGEVVFDSVAADRVLPDDQDVATPDAVRNPYEPAISFTTGFFAWPPLRASITDTHFARRNRFGRLAAFMARALRDGLVRTAVVYGVAVDEGAALLVDGAGNATLVQRRRESDGYVPRGAYVLEGNRSGRVFPGTPLRYVVKVTHILMPGSRYNLIRHTGAGRRYRVTVDGKHAAIYSPEPY